jgi:hypothetical protein
MATNEQMMMMMITKDGGLKWLRVVVVGCRIRAHNYAVKNFSLLSYVGGTVWSFAC